MENLLVRVCVCVVLRILQYETVLLNAIKVFNAAILLAQI